MDLDTTKLGIGLEVVPPQPLFLVCSLAMVGKRKGRLGSHRGAGALAKVRQELAALVPLVA